MMQIVNILISLVVIRGLFALMFKYVPDAEVHWRDVNLGAFVTVLLFMVGEYLIGLYLGSSNNTENFGAAGSLVVLLLWVDYSAQISFFGAEFTQVYANTYGRGVVPAENAEHISEESRRQQGIPHQAGEGAVSSQQAKATENLSYCEREPDRSRYGSDTAGDERQPALKMSDHPAALRTFSSLVGVLVPLVSGYLLGLGSKSKRKKRIMALPFSIGKRPYLGRQIGAPQVWGPQNLGPFPA